MARVLLNSWALFIGMFLLMIGNGVQGTLLGLRGAVEEFSTFQMSIVMSAYFLGFLGGSRFAPEMIRRVGHVRVFAALGSLISAVLILYPVLVDPWAWTIGRVIIGFCFSGVYVTAESWLNNSVTNENRGKTLSAYMVVQMGGVVLAQYLLLLGDVSGFVLFIVPSVLVSLAFAPILLSVAPTPAFETSKPLALRQLVEASPLASAGMFLLGGVYAAQFGMAAVYGAIAGLSVAQISIFVSTIYLAALILQYPIGWLSDRTERRVLIIWLAFIGGAGSLVAILFFGNFWAILVSAVVIGGTSNPLYAMLLAYANDYLEPDDMAAASAGYVFVNGLGAVAGPLIVGGMMDIIGPSGFWVYLVVLMISLGLYGVWRSLQRPTTTSVDDQSAYVPLTSASSAVAVEWAQDEYLETEGSDTAESERPAASA